MTNKLELFKPEDCFDGYLYLDTKPTDVKRPELGPPWIKGDYMELNDINRILNERLSAGYTEEKRGSGARKTMVAYEAISPEKHTADTHKIFYLTQPIEEEKAECEHVLESILSVTFDTQAGFSGHGSSINNYCPKCGEKLK